MRIEQISVFPEGRGRYYKVTQNGQESFVYDDEEIRKLVKEAEKRIELAGGKGITHPIDLIELVNKKNKLLEVKVGNG